MNRQEEILQIKCYTWFHNTYPELRGLLNYNLNNPRNEMDGQTAKLMGLQKGRPDMELNYKGKTYFIELKLPHTTLSEAQKTHTELLTTQGFPVHICRTEEAFKTYLYTLLPTPK